VCVRERVCEFVWKYVFDCENDIVSVGEKCDTFMRMIFLFSIQFFHYSSSIRTHFLNTRAHTHTQWVWTWACECEQYINVRINRDFSLHDAFISVHLPQYKMPSDVNIWELFFFPLFFFFKWKKLHSMMLLDFRHKVSG
jgi:hypothetical protein